MNTMKESGQYVDFNTIVFRKNDIKTVDFDGEIAIMDGNKGTYYYMDLIGSEIWGILQKPITTNEIAYQLILQYDIDIETCRKHVHDFIIELFNRDLILM